MFYPDLGPKTVFLPRVEALRGMAALTVASFHISATLASSAYADKAVKQITFPIFMAVMNGYGAVVAFFVISGFVLAGSLDRNPDPMRFAWNRIFRLYPAGAFAVGMFAIWFYCFNINVYNADYNFKNIALNFLMLHADIDRVMWSMQVELIATPLIWSSVWIYHRSDWRILIIGVAILFGLSFIGQFSHALGDGSNLAPVYAFVVGVLIQFQGDRIASKIGPRVTPILALSSVLVLSICGYLKPIGTFPLLFECLSAAMMLTLVVYRPRSRLFNVLDWRPVRFYGRISYSFYLLHPLTFFFINPISDKMVQAVPWLSFSIIAAIASSISIGLITPVAYFSWRFLEIPGIKLGRILAQRRNSAPVAR